MSRHTEIKLLAAFQSEPIRRGEGELHAAIVEHYLERLLRLRCLYETALVTLLTLTVTGLFAAIWTQDFAIPSMTELWVEKGWVLVVIGVGWLGLCLRLASCSGWAALDSVKATDTAFELFSEE